MKGRGDHRGPQYVAGALGDWSGPRKPPMPARATTKAARSAHGRLAPPGGLLAVAGVLF
jgi:hypothetical protein